MDFTAYPAVVCTCGHDLIIGPADPADNGTDTFNFVGKCANEGVCDHLDWVVSITAGAPPAARAASRRGEEKAKEPEPEEKAAKR